MLHFSNSSSKNSSSVLQIASEGRLTEVVSIHGDDSLQPSVHDSDCGSSGWEGKMMDIPDKLINSPLFIVIHDSPENLLSALWKMGVNSGGGVNKVRNKRYLVPSAAETVHCDCDVQVIIRYIRGISIRWDDISVFVQIGSLMGE
ncbi:hypothetical protein LINPERPRIM_LOCUS22741 [Linum perenne]